MIIYLNIETTQASIQYILYGYNKLNKDSCTVQDLLAVKNTLRCCCCLKMKLSNNK